MTWSVLYNITCVDVGATQGQSRYIQQLKRDKCLFQNKHDQNFLDRFFLFNDHINDMV